MMIIDVFVVSYTFDIIYGYIFLMKVKLQIVDIRSV
jgi:hypothetical protein